MMSLGETLRWVFPSFGWVLFGMILSAAAFIVSYRLNGQKAPNKVKNMVILALALAASGIWASMHRFVAHESYPFRPMVMQASAWVYLVAGDWLAYAVVNFGNRLERWIWERTIRNIRGEHPQTGWGGRRILLWIVVLLMAALILVPVVLGGLSVEVQTIEVGELSLADSIMPSPSPTPCPCVMPTSSPSPTATLLPPMATPTQLPPMTPMATLPPVRCERFPAAVWLERSNYQTRSYQYIRDGPGTGYTARGTITRNAEAVPVYWRLTTQEGLWLSMRKNCADSWLAGWLGLLESQLLSE